MHHPILIRMKRNFMKNNDQEAKTEGATKTEGHAVDESQTATHWVLGVWYVLFPCCMAFVMLTPVDVLQRYPQVVPYVDWMASWHPYVHRIGLTEISGHLADVNRFCAAVMWSFLSPLMVLVFTNWFVRGDGIKPFKSVLEMFFAVIAAPLLAYAFLYATGDMDSRIGRFMAINSLGRAFFIPNSPLIFWFLTYMTFECWRNTFRRNFDF